jgi:hypothetical protein
VAGIPARCVLGDQVRAGQLGQRLAGSRERQPGQAGGGGGGDIRAGMHAQ